MSPTFSKAALRVLVSILLASSLANAAALPHQVLDPRAPLTEDIPNPEEALQAIQSAVKQDPGNFFDNISDDLSNRSAWQVFLDFVTRLFGPRENSNGAATTTVFVTPTPSDIILPPGPPTATSVVLTSTSTEISTSTSIEVSTSTSTEIPSISTTIPTSISTEVSTNTTTEVSTSTSTEIEILTSISSEVPTITLTEVSTSTSTEIEILTSISTEVSLNISTVIPTNTSSSEASSTTEKPFSILPIEPITTAINATFLTPVFSTGPEISLPLLTPSVGIPPFPANSSYEYVLPTAVPITGEFSTTIPVELLTSSVPLAINSSEPTGTGLPLPWAGNTTESAINPTLILTEPVAPTPVTNESEALNSTSTTLSLTSIIIVTETIIPSPLSGTGIEASASVGTGIPISEIASPLWPNSTYVEPTILPGTGTGSPSIGTALPLSDLPIYPNVTNATTSAVAEEPSIVLLPITVTGLPGGTIGVTVTIPTAPFPNTTVTESSIPLGTGSLEPSAGTELPVPESEIPLFPNTTFTLIAPTTIPFPSGTGPSIETILPIETLSESVPYPNTTTETVVDIATDTATATLILPSLPTETIIDNATEMATETLILPGLPTETIVDIATDTATETLVLPSVPTATDAAIEFPGQLSATLPVVLPESDLVLAPTEGYKH